MALILRFIPAAHICRSWLLLKHGAVCRQCGRTKVGKPQVVAFPKEAA